MRERKWITRIIEWVKGVTYKWIRKRNRGDQEEVQGDTLESLDVRKSARRLRWVGGQERRVHTETCIEKRKIEKKIINS